MAGAHESVHDDSLGPSQGPASRLDFGHRVALGFLRMSILVLNSGSTSLKFSVFDHDGSETQLSGSLEWAGGNRAEAEWVVRKPGQAEIRSRMAAVDDRTAARQAIQAVAREHRIAVVGHRVVYGGTVLRQSTLIDAGVKASITELSKLAPLHNPPALAGIEAAEAALPGVPQVAVFDTAFFANLPERACLYPLPYEWHTRHGIRRIGFHGISNAYCLGRAAELLHRSPSDLRLITCHLGGGCSATAVQGGRPVSTTMGFTPLEGLMMGTRCGSGDPGVLLYLQKHCGVTLDELEHALNHQSGLLGVSGISADLAPIERAAQAGNLRAQLAFDLFADRVRSAIGALAVTMGGLDALIFTDRIGESSHALRAAACHGLECLGVRLDPNLNACSTPDTDIATTDSLAHVLVIRTREDLMIAREAKRWASAVA